MKSRKRHKNSLDRRIERLSNRLQNTSDDKRREQVYRRVKNALNERDQLRIAGWEEN